MSTKTQQANTDSDPIETQEWVDALSAIIKREGTQRAHYILGRLAERATRTGAPLPYEVTTPYRNTIPTADQEPMPGDLFMERRIRSLVRWNAMAMVMRANMDEGDIGGHISSFSSSATLYDVGFNYFFRAPSDEQDGDLIFFQGHASPGAYARSFLEGRLSEEQLDRFRREVDGNGLSSYPHPWLMPEYWQFPTVSMGLGPIQAIYQAHVMKYLSNRKMVDVKDRKVWAFLGDGETDEPESLGVISLAGREKLDNLIFVVNCNLQRLDGPVRGNGKIIQDLEGQFRGAGWNVIKVVWGRRWDPLLEKDEHGLLQKRMDEVVDGEYQNYKAKGGSYTREHFFGSDPELLKMVEDYSDDDIYNLNRGGHDPYKVYAAYARAMKTKGQPTVILAKTVKGYAVGASGEATNVTHSIKKLDTESLQLFRDRFNIPLSNEQLKEVPYYRPAADSPEMVYMHNARAKLGGYLPQRRVECDALEVPQLTAFQALLDGSGDKQLSTTMAFVRLLNVLVKDKAIGKRVVPIVPDEARTFGMEGMFRQLGIYSSEGQLYEPADSHQVMYYKEDIEGQVLEEGINEAGAFSAWMAAATSYSNHDFPLVPFYIFYSMFGFQRIGDLAWAAGDLQARGFLIGATAGRTTLNGEGLQHQDGHSHLLAATIPNCVSYDPSFACELAVIVQHGLQRMYVDKENIYYYITTMNENYQQPALVSGKENDIIKGMYLFQQAENAKVQLLGCGTIMQEVLAAKDLLLNDYGINANIWSVTSFNELRKDGLSVERWNRLHPQMPPKECFVQQQLSSLEGPIIAASDYMKSYADQIRAFVSNSYTVLGTDGYGRSDTRENLRQFFEVDRFHIVLATLTALKEFGEISTQQLQQAIDKYQIDSESQDPVSR